MKYEILTPFRDYLNTNIKNKNTADRYYYAVNSFFKGLHFDDLSEIPLDFIKDKLSELRTKNQFSAIKNGLKYLKKFDANLNIPSDEFFKKTSLKKKNLSSKPPKTLYLDTINRKTNAVKNLKLKFAYKIMQFSGARVSEVAMLQKKDINIKGDLVQINILHGKGNSNGKVEFTNKKLAQSLKEFLEPLKSSEKVFYTAGYMKGVAWQRGLECHDFRRIAAIQYKKSKMEDGNMTLYDINEATKKFLRHARFSTTKRYLYNRKLKIKKSEGKCEQ